MQITVKKPLTPRRALSPQKSTLAEQGPDRGDTYAGMAGGLALGLGGGALGTFAGFAYGMSTVEALSSDFAPVQVLGVLTAIPVGMMYGMIGGAVGGALGSGIGMAAGIGLRRKLDQG